MQVEEIENSNVQNKEKVVFCELLQAQYIGAQVLFGEVSGNKIEDRATQSTNTECHHTPGNVLHTRFTIMNKIDEVSAHEEN